MPDTAFAATPEPPGSLRSMESTPIDPALPPAPTSDPNPAPGYGDLDELAGVRHFVRADYPAPDPIPDGPMPPMDMRVSTTDATPLAALNDLLAAFGLPPVPEGTHLHISMVFHAVTDPKADMARLADQFGDWVTVELGVLGAFDEDAPDPDDEGLDEEFDEDTMADWGQNEDGEPLGDDA